MNRAFSGYFAARPSFKEPDSTGPNFGAAIRSGPVSLLNIPADQAGQYDFRIYHQTLNGKKKYYVYVFDSLSGHSPGGRSAARYVFQTGADGKPILDEGAAAAGTGKVSTKLADGKDQLKFLDASGFSGSRIHKNTARRFRGRGAVFFYCFRRTALRTASATAAASMPYFRIKAAYGPHSACVSESPANS